MNAIFFCKSSHTCWTWCEKCGQNESVGKNEAQRRGKSFCWQHKGDFEWSIFWASWKWFWILNICHQDLREAWFAMKVFDFQHKYFSQKQKAFKLQFYRETFFQSIRIWKRCFKSHHAYFERKNHIYLADIFGWKITFSI